jgi:hypothetical protein
MGSTLAALAHLQQDTVEKDIEAEVAPPPAFGRCRPSLAIADVVRFAVAFAIRRHEPHANAIEETLSCSYHVFP